MFPSQLEYNSSLHPETAQMFQTITSALNEIQAKLSTIQNQYTQQDAQLKKLENSLEKISDQGKGVSRPTLKSSKSPRGLSVSYIFNVNNYFTIWHMHFRLAYAASMQPLKKSMMLAKSKLNYITI